MGCRKEKVSLTLDSNLVFELKQRAHNSDRSFSQYVNHVLREYTAHQVTTEKGPKKMEYKPEWRPKR